jgi:uncharacterized membrane protein YhiD involved in acid resistance
MDLKKFFDSLSPIAMGNPIGLEVIFWRMIAALGFALIIGGVSYIAYSGREFEKSNLHAQILVTLVAAMVINVIGDSFARAVGLFGAMSFIRFRTTLRDTKDTAIFFFSVAIGMSTGLGFFELSMIAMLIILPLLFALKYIPVFKMEISEIELVCSDNDAMNAVREYLKTLKVKLTLAEVKIGKLQLVFHYPYSAEKAYILAEQIKKDNAEIITNYNVKKIQ